MPPNQFSLQYFSNLVNCICPYRLSIFHTPAWVAGVMEGEGVIGKCIMLLRNASKPILLAVFLKFGQLYLSRLRVMTGIWNASKPHILPVFLKFGMVQKMISTWYWAGSYVKVDIKSKHCVESNFDVWCKHYVAINYAHVQFGPECNFASTKMPI